ncbi:MAG: DUF2357 domain-containing protein [Clostridiales bacterium]|nr:DUF2357 domain-containing protein [Clostridiales bacterium]
MAKSVAQLYNEFRADISEIYNGEPFYQKILSDTERGKNEFSLFNRYFEKKIDLRWVDAIEACIIPLDTIIRNPRKFIVQEEEIVPIERARKITAESVRHLAQHTNLIARVEGDTVTPTSILNVFREESFEIYENRFIFTLLRNLQRFIDDRYNVLFNMANDEEMSSLKMNSEFVSGHEKINYKLEISAQTINERVDEHIDDPKSASAFQRIERIKRIVNEFAHSSFINELRNCTPVRPPIMRTNVISKDPNFKACLALWQFISAYDEVGYEIISNESNDMVSDDYRDNLFKMVGVNYMMLKGNSMAQDKLNELIEEVKKGKGGGSRRTRRLKPKMIKRVVEEIVTNYDMDEVEIRKIFLDELKRQTKKKIAGEEKIKAAIGRALASEKARKAAIEAKIKAEIQRKKDIEKRKRQRELARIAKEKALEKERIAKEKARIKAKKEKELALAKEKAAKERERQRIAKQKALEAERIAKEKERARIQKEKERAAKLKALEEEKKRKAAELAKQRKLKEQELLLAKKEKEKAAKAAQREREREAREKALQAEKAKAAAAREKERARIAAEKAKQAEKDKLAREKQREKERIAKEKAAQIAKEKAAIAKQKEKEKLAKQKALQAEKDKLAREKQKEKERLAKEKAAQIAKEKAAIAKQKEKEKLAKQKALQAEKEKLAREKQKEKERLAKEKAAQIAKEKAALAKQKEKERLAKEKAAQIAKEKAALAKQKEKEKLAKQKAAQANNKKTGGNDENN